MGNEAVMDKPLVEAVSTDAGTVESTTEASPTMKLMKSKPKTAETVEPAIAVDLAVASGDTVAVVAAKKVVKAKVAEDKGAAVVATVAVEDDLIAKTATEVENMKEEKALKLIPALMNGMESDKFKLGGVLSLVQANGWHMDQGYESFRAFVENAHGLKYRKVMYLIANYNGLVKSGVRWSQVEILGWSKLKEVIPILTKENVTEWVDLITGQEMTVIQLQEYIKALTAGDTLPKTDTAEAKKTVTMTFKLHEDQKATVKEALDKAKHEVGTTVDTVALEAICLDFLGGASKLQQMPTLKDLMASKSAEEVLGIFGDVFPNINIEATME
jgi:hypothetical protein